MLAALFGAVAASASEETAFEVNARTMGVGIGDFGEAVFRSADGREERVKVPNNTRSEAYRFRATNPVEILRSAPADGMGIAMSRDERLVKTLSLDPGAASYLFVFVGKSGGVSDGECDVLAIAGDVESFPVSSYLFVNQSGLSVRGNMSGQSFDLADGERVLLTPDFSQGRQFGVKLYCRDPGKSGDQGWRQFVSNAWTDRGTQQVLIVLAPPESNEMRPRMVVSAHRPSKSTE